MTVDIEDSTKKKSPFAMPVHFGSLQEMTHLQTNNSKTASGAGGDRIQ